MWLIDLLKDSVPELLTAVVATGVTWFFTRKKKKAEVKTNELENVDQVIKFWREFGEDQNKRYEKIESGQAKLIEENLKLKTEIAKLKQELHALLEKNKAVVELQKDKQKLTETVAKLKGQLKNKSIELNKLKSSQEK